MIVQENISLRSYNSFGLDVRASEFCAFKSTDELVECLSRGHNAKMMILGGGSNVLFTEDYEGLVLRNEIPGIELIEDKGDVLILRAGAGVLWHELVMHCVAQGYGGIENLSLIPGSVGAAPMQNIGAYGVEIKDVFHSLEALHIASGEIHTFNKDDCLFGYRESVFKRGLKGEYVICSMSLKLSRSAEFNTNYGAIQQELDAMAVEASIVNISQAVINIRQRKLPDPHKIGNAGSFFKNPVLAHEQFDELIGTFSDMPNYSAPNGRKVAAGWLIEQCGWKGKDFGGYGVHDRQALVLVNRGGASGEEIYNLSEEIIASVQERFGIALEREVNVI